MLQNLSHLLLKYSNETLFIYTAGEIPASTASWTDTKPWAECAFLFAQVQKHLSKLFDNMAKMRFESDGEGNPSKTVLGMYIREEEYVPFNHSCDCTGQVKHAGQIFFWKFSSLGWAKCWKTFIILIRLFAESDTMAV